MKTLKSKIISAIMIISILVSLAGISVYAEEKATENPSQAISPVEEVTLTVEEAQALLENQKKELEEKLSESDAKLALFEESAKATSDYIETLDEKIGYLNEELNLLDSQVKNAQKKVKKLDRQITSLENELADVRKNYEEAKQELSGLESKYEESYNLYCDRLRALYISGNDSVIVALMTSTDISNFFNRYEMIRAISENDSALLNDLSSQMKKIDAKKTVISEQKAKLEFDAMSLDDKRAELNNTKAEIENTQASIAQKKIRIAEDRAESDALYAKYTAKTQLYTEYKYEDEQLIAQVEGEINDLLNGLKAPEEVTTASAGNIEHDAQAPQSEQSDENALYSNSNAVLNLTYPAPGHYAVSQTYGHYRNGKPHTGIDFPYPVGSKVVAAQKGIVITVKRLDYSYGYYVMIYHGTDAKGRKIVTLYAHNSSLLVSNGQTVKKGQQIAKGGSTGNSTGPHCHFEMIIDGQKVNPANYLSK